MKKNLLFSLVITLVILITGCSKETQAVLKDNGVINDTIYEDYSLWLKPNELTIYTEPNIKINSQKEAEFNFDSTMELSKKYKKEVEKLKKGIIDYFLKEYNLDISEKLNNQKVRMYSVDEFDTNVSFGCVDPQNRDILNLNKMVFDSEYADYFSNIYIHESLHQIGFIDMNAENLVDGIVDAYTDLILCSMGLESYPTPTYFEARTLAYQLILVDRELPALYIGDSKFSIAKRITERLKDVPRSDMKCGNPGKELIKRTILLYSNNQGTLQSNNDPVWYAFEAQSIVYSYLRTFELSNADIDYIREHYLVSDFENLKHEGVNYIE